MKVQKVATSKSYAYIKTFIFRASLMEASFICIPDIEDVYFTSPSTCECYTKKPKGQPQDILTANHNNVLKTKSEHSYTYDDCMHQ
jgi:hypothetical protein